MQTTPYSGRSAWLLTLSAAAILAITMGSMQSTGLFISPLDKSSGLGIASISFALAVGQIVTGVAQPLFGVIADKKGSFRVLIIGTLMLAAGFALTPAATSKWAIIATLGVLTAAGAGAASFSILIGAVSRQLPPERRSLAGGFINAGGSFGQFFFAPLLQMLITGFGWVAAMLAMAATTLAIIPLSSFLHGGIKHEKPVEPQPSEGLMHQIRIAMGDRSYWCLHAGFFTCGFHVAFLATHLPGEVALHGHAASVSAASLSIIGLFNIAGSLSVGALGTRYRMKYILAAVYGSRAMILALFLFAPKTSFTFYIFSAALGLTWLATVPPTAGLVGKLFGTKYMTTLFGLTLLTHQVGAFLGVWLGGLAMAHAGNYHFMWYTGILLSFAAAMVNFPIREPKVRV